MTRDHSYDGVTHIRLVIPAGPPGPGRVARIQQCLAALGFDVSVGRHADAHHGFLAASDDARLHDLHAAFGDPDVDVVLATRGGYGTQRLLDQLDRDLVARSEVLFVGFSDLTALHVVLNQECGRRSVYAPAPDWAVVDPASTAATSFLTAVGDPASWTVHSDATEPTSSLTRGGSVTGQLVGGNLTLLASAAG